MYKNVYAQQTMKLNISELVGILGMEPIALILFGEKRLLSRLDW